MILFYAVFFLFVLFVLKGIYNWVRAIILRFMLYAKLGRISRENGYTIETPRFILASFFKLSAKPDVIIRTSDTEYIVRIITCRARKRIYHFANHEWFVRAFRYYILSLAFHSGEPLTVTKICKYLPPLGEEYISCGELRRQVVLLFNPSPLEITYTTRTNQREIGTNGSDFDGWMIYNAKGFTNALTSKENT